MSVFLDEKPNRKGENTTKNTEMSSSFSARVKREICSTEQADCCARASSYGLVYLGRYFEPTRVGILTEYEFVAQKYLQALDLLTGYKGKYTLTPSGRYKVEITDTAETILLFNELGYSGKEFSFRLQENNLENECCRMAFLRGAFLSCGVVTDPQRSYHLEFCTSSAVKARAVLNVFEQCGYSPKMSNRGSSRLVYFKKKEEIEDVLVELGSQQCSLEYIGQDIHKNIRNDVNRRVNCDNANIKRVCDASKKQIDAINSLIESGEIDNISPELKSLALLRLENPDYSLSELGESLSPKLSRSGVNHRLQRLIQISQSK